MTPQPPHKEGGPEFLLDLAIKCLDIPRLYREGEPLSYRDLVVKLGYCRWRKHLTKAVFKSAFQACPEKMPDWQQWSWDQRWSPSWYLEDEGERVVVGYYSPDSWWRNRKRSYSDRAKSYATFVKHILDGIARRVEQ